MAKPKWATPERQACLARLFAKYGNRCLQGHYLCPEPSHYIHNRTVPLIAPIPVKVSASDKYGNPIYDTSGNRLKVTIHKLKISRVVIPEVTRLYDLVIERIIKDWIADDRQARAYQRRLERSLLHKLPEKGAVRGSFNSISRTIFFDKQPLYYMEAMGVSGLTFRAFAKVRISSSYTRLHVDISEPLKKASKNRRRKAIRYAKSLPLDIHNEVESLCSRAVRHYLKI